MANPLAIELHASGSESSDGNGSGVDTSKDSDGTAGVYTRGAAKLLLEVSVANGTNPTLDVIVESSPNQTGPWEKAGEFDQKTGTGFQRLNVAGLERWVRVSWTLGGSSPDFTFKVSGDAHVIYGQPADLVGLGMPAKALANLTDDTKARALLAATGECDRHMGAATELPLTAWGESLRMRSCLSIAAWDLMSFRGFRPADADDTFETRYRDAIMQLKGLANELVNEGVTDNTPDTLEPALAIESDTARGW